jgi:hypothetical protein
MSLRFLSSWMAFVCATGSVEVRTSAAPSRSMSTASAGGAEGSSAGAWRARVGHLLK